MSSNQQTSVELETCVPGMVSILIVNWNAQRYLQGMLQSIRDVITVPHEVIFVDNNSSDESVALVESEFPEVRLIRSAENLGFIRGTNLAARHARGEFLFLLNPDTIMQSDLAPAVRLLQVDKRVGVVGASMYGGNGKLLTKGGAFPSVPRLLILRSMFWKPRRGPWGPTEFGAQRVDWVGGSWLLTRVTVWNQVGGLDERLFMYCDEMHYCRGLKELGFITVIMPALTYIHFRGFSHRRLRDLYAGYRWFHERFSGGTRRFLATMVMKWGLRARVLGYAVLGTLFRKSEYMERRRSMQNVLDSWDQPITTAPRSPTERPNQITATGL